jgi:lysophospholipase L1-like esterase
VDYLVIMLGTNDCNPDLDLSAEDIADGMEKLIMLAEEEAPGLQGYIPEIIIVAPGAIRADFSGSPFAYELTDGAVRKSEDIGDLYKGIAEKHMCRAVDATGAVEVSDDCMHLTETGHRQLAELICREIKRDPASYDVELDLVP